MKEENALILADKCTVLRITDILQLPPPFLDAASTNITNVSHQRHVAIEVLKGEKRRTLVVDEGVCAHAWLSLRMCVDFGFGLLHHHNSAIHVERVSASKNYSNKQTSLLMIVVSQVSWTTLLAV